MLYEKLEKLEDRKDLPLNGPDNYRVNNSIVYTRAIEINAVRQCNLSCRSCSHSSPIAPCNEYNPEDIERDLLKISQYLHSEFVRLLGGEPLLHSNFLEVLKVIKRTNISDKICLVTNGILLDNISDEMLKYIDKIEISMYPLNKTLLQKIKSNALKLSEKGVKVRILEYSDFRESISQYSTDNQELKQLIYETCQVAHNWRCITVDNDKLYRCPQSMIYSEKNNDFSDSICISKLSNIYDLLAFLENNYYLNSCSCCFGSVGKKINHQQIKRDEWTSILPETIESGIDKEYARTLIKKMNFKSDCMKRKNLN